MRLRVRLFSVVRDVVGSSELTIELPEGAKVKDLVNALVEMYPKLKELEEEIPLLVLVNGSPASDETPVGQGDEIALIPPASGGEVRIVRNGLSLDNLVDEITSRTSEKGAGALVIFVGFVKGVVEGARVRELRYEAYEPFASRKLEEIERAIKSKEGVIDAMLFHRVGGLRPGEPALYVIVSAVNRGVAFDAAREAVELVKREVPVFKLEVRDDGEYWVVGERRVKRSSTPQP